MPTPDLFVVCRNCGAEVSQYITECPYCGTRLRKRAPKLDREGRPTERRRRRAPTPPRLGRLRRGEIPGVRADVRPYATMALVVGSIAATLAWRGGAMGLDDVVVSGELGSRWWRALTAPFIYDNTGYQLVALVAVAIFGWLLERRHGLAAPVVVFLAGGAGGLALAGLADLDGLAMGGNGAALAMTAAWAVPDLVDRRRGIDTEGDLLGVAVIAAVLLALPVAATSASAVAGLAGGLVGLLLGGLLNRLAPER